MGTKDAPDHLRVSHTAHVQLRRASSGCPGRGGRFVMLREARERPRSVAWQHDASAMISLNPPRILFTHLRILGRGEE